MSINNLYVVSETAQVMSYTWRKKISDSVLRLKKQVECSTLKDVRCQLKSA